MGRGSHMMQGSPTSLVAHLPVELRGSYPSTRMPPPEDIFHVQATPGDGWWGITVDELGTVFAQTQHFEDVEAEARSAIAFWFDVDESRVGGIVVTAAEVTAS